MQVICAWCQEDLGCEPDTAMDTASVSHGICEECAEAVRAELSAMTHVRNERPLTV